MIEHRCRIAIVIAVIGMSVAVVGCDSASTGNGTRLKSAGEPCVERRECTSGSCTFDSRIETSADRKCDAPSGSLVRGVACRRFDECASGECAYYIGQSPNDAVCWANGTRRPGESCFYFLR